MERVKHPQCARLAGFAHACMDISHFRSEQWLVERGNDIALYQSKSNGTEGHCRKTMARKQCL